MGYMYNDSAIFVTGSMALSSSLYISWGDATGSATAVGFTQNNNGTLLFKDHASGSWTELGNSRDDTQLGDAAADVITANGQLTASQGISATLNSNFDANVTLGNASTDTTTVTGRLTGSQGMLIKDNQKLYFGNGEDGYIMYDEAGDDILEIGGTAVVFQIPDDDNGALVIKERTNVYMTFDTTDGDEIIQSNKEHEFVGGAVVNDDQKLYFGTDDDAYIEYDEDGTDELIISGALGGIDIQAPQGVADGLTLSTNGFAMLTFDTRGDEEVATFAYEAKFGRGAVVSDNQQLIFGSDDDAYIKYDETSSDELIISGALGGIDIQAPQGVADGLTLSTNGSAMLTFDTRGDEEVATFAYEAKFDEGAVVSDNQQLIFGSDDDASMEYDEDGTDQLVLTPPDAGMSIGSGFHRIAQDVSVNKAHSSDNTVAVQMSGVKIPNDAILTRIVAIPKVLSNLGTAVYNIQLSATNSTAADSAVSSGDEILGAGGTGTVDSNGASASDIVMSSGGVLKKVWMNTTVQKMDADYYVYIANAGTGNGTTDPSQGTLTVIIEYYGID